MAKSEGSYIIALFDCCREKIDDGATRGLGGVVDEGAVIGPVTHENFIITYGCPPTEGVPAKSTIAQSYMSYLRRCANKDGYVALPGPLNFFVGSDGKCEHSIKVNSPLLLKYQRV